MAEQAEVGSGLSIAQFDPGGFELTFPGQPGGDPGGVGYGEVFTYSGPGSTKIEHYIIHDAVLGVFTAPNLRANYSASAPTDFDPRLQTLPKAGKRFLASQVHNNSTFAAMSAPPAGGAAYVAEAPGGSSDSARAYLYRVSNGANGFFDTWAYGPSFDFAAQGTPMVLHPQPGLNNPNTWKNHVNTHCVGGEKGFCSWSYVEIK